MNKSEFTQAIDDLRSPDSMVYEEGYYSLISHVDQYFAELVTLMQSEENVNLRGRFIEVLGSSESEAIIAVLAAELTSE